MLKFLSELGEIVIGGIVDTFASDYEHMLRTKYGIAKPFADDEPEQLELPFDKDGERRD